jgi:hypothetical protein
MTGDDEVTAGSAHHFGFGRDSTAVVVNDVYVTFNIQVSSSLGHSSYLSPSFTL